MYNYGRQVITDRDVEGVTSVLETDFLTQGPKVAEFETALKTFMGANDAAVVSNGTAALHLAGLAMGWGSLPSDIVLVPALTFAATANAVIMTGASVDFVDIDPYTLAIDLNQVEDKLRKSSKIKSVVGVDFGGAPCDWINLRFLAERYGITLLNDNCHALGAEYDGRIDYACEYADLVTQSFHPVKMITTGEGGAVVSNKSDLIERIHSLRSHGMTRSHDRSKQEPWRQDMVDFGFNYRLTDFQCALGISQLSNIEKNLKERRALAKLYTDALERTEHCSLQTISENKQSAYHLFIVMISFGGFSSKNKVDLYQGLQRDLGVNLQVHYPPVPSHSYYRNYLGERWNQFPMAFDYYSRAFSLPIYPGLDPHIVIEISSYIKTFLEDVS